MNLPMNDDAEGYQLDSEVLKLFGNEQFSEYHSLPVRDGRGKLHIAYSQVNGFEFFEIIQLALHEPVLPLSTTEAFLLQFPGATSINTSSDTIDSPAVRLVNVCIQEAKHNGSSDIHFESLESGAQVRIREDGILKIFRQIPLEHKNEVVSRLKIMAQLDISEKRRPQDGRIEVVLNNDKIDIRVSVIPTDYGEKVVLRLLDQSAVELDLKKLGFPKLILEQFSETIQRPNGLILVTGPTGSGKTTTLYSALKAISTPEINISTVEDPVEYRLKGINQTQVKPEIGVDFAAALRSLLRQDPNVILIGEIRDKETADLAIRASLTGHLVLSTLHTNDAPSAISRLMDIGVENYQISSALSLVLAQRLVRRVCSTCQGKGCNTCKNTGYKGRIALYESLLMNDTLREMISSQSSMVQFKETAKEYGWTPLRVDGEAKIKQGLTTLEELNRETVL